jgi:DNA-binding NarL/FixJ family response regulator
VGESDGSDDVLALAESLRADVIVSDLELGGRSALDVLRRARDSAVAIVIFSGHANTSLIERTLAAGAAAFVVKGGDLQVLLDRVHSLGRRTNLSAL